ncbi:MAG: L-rhamnonate dehydratase [Gemmobacter sp.]
MAGAVTMDLPCIRHLRALTLRGGGGDYHDQPTGHWIDTRIATPMSRWPEYRETRRSFGLNILGTLVIELEAEDGTVGFGVTTGGDIGAWIAEAHLARFVEGAGADSIADIWDRMYSGTLFYGRRGLVLNVISGIDLALWDLLGKLTARPVWQLLGGKVRDELTFYATGPRPDIARDLGFIGGKLPLRHAPAEGDDGLRANIDRLREAREQVGPDFWLMYDCWMALDLPYALRLAEGCAEHGLKWIEEALPPDDYWGYRDLRAALAGTTWVTTGEHEATRWGFRHLIEMGCADVLQPDVGWCGGLSELVRIADMAEAAGVRVIPHGSSVYSYHFVATRAQSTFAEFLMMAPDAGCIVPMYGDLFRNEPLPRDGRLAVSDAPGFGVDLNRALPFARPHRR